MKLFLASLLTTTLSFIPTTANAYESTSSKVTKTFRFKDDFFLKIDPLSTAIAPGVNTDDLLSALDAYGETFRDKWVLSLMLNTLPQDECEVVVRSFVLIGECSFGPLCTVSRMSFVPCNLHSSYRRCLFLSFPLLNGDILRTTTLKSCLRLDSHIFILIPM